MWNELILLLKAQSTLCAQLIELNERQKKSLLEKSLEEMRAIVQQQESLFGKFSKLEDKKQLFLQKKQMEYSDVKLAVAEDCAALVKEPERENLLTCAKELEERLKMLKTSNQEVQKLLDNAMRFIDFNVNIITQTTADDIYAPQGQSGSVISKKKMFDQSI